jgi:hypothetical protein
VVVNETGGGDDDGDDDVNGEEDGVFVVAFVSFIFFVVVSFLLETK